MRYFLIKAARRTGIFFLSLLIGFVTLEVCSAILIVSGYIADRLPSYRWQNVKDQFYEPHSIFGGWHVKNSRYKRDLSSVISYNANSYGAADIERSKENNSALQRVVVLGDSFVEGKGVDQSKRFTSIFEKESGHEYLNFGMSMFGPVQYYLVYKHLAKVFQHDVVLVGILPHNDFLDNDKEYGDHFYKKAYRPYFVGAYPNYALVYSNPTVSLKKWRRKRVIKGLFREFTFSYTVLKYLFLQSRHVFLEKKLSMAIEERGDDQKETYSGYYDFTQEQFNILKFSIEKIQEEAGGKTLIIVTYPAINDLHAYQKLGTSPLTVKLERLSSEIGFEYIDLLPYFYHKDKNWGSYYLQGKSGGHYTEYGHQTVVDGLRSVLRKSLPH